jgi:hypothetical protein
MARPSLKRKRVDDEEIIMTPRLFNIATRAGKRYRCHTFNVNSTPHGELIRKTILEAADTANDFEGFFCALMVMMTPEEQRTEVHKAILRKFISFMDLAFLSFAEEDWGEWYWDNETSSRLEVKGETLMY